MKTLKTVLTLALVLSSLIATKVMAGDPQITLDKKVLSVDSASVVVVRTSSTPDRVKLKLSIPFGETVCENYGTEIVFGQDPSCGYDTVYVTEHQCSTSTVCEVSRNGVCESSRDVESCQDVCVPESVMRSCDHPETVCTQYGVETSNREKHISLDFNKLGQLAAGKEQVIRISGAQNHTDGVVTKYTAEVLSSDEKIVAKVESFLGHRVIFKKAK